MGCWGVAFPGVQKKPTFQADIGKIEAVKLGNNLKQNGTVRRRTNVSCAHVCSRAVQQHIQYLPCCPGEGNGQAYSNSRLPNLASDSSDLKIEIVIKIKG